jgi:hypothetical protein
MRDVLALRPSSKAWIPVLEELTAPRRASAAALLPDPIHPSAVPHARDWLNGPAKLCRPASTLRIRGVR